MPRLYPPVATCCWNLKVVSCPFPNSGAPHEGVERGSCFAPLSAFAVNVIHKESVDQ